MTTSTRFSEVISRLGSQRILVLGDVMLDRFIWGKVDRISPEAPVPVVRVQRESIYPGGAANVARNLIPFSAQVRMIGRIGADAVGAELRAVLDQGGIDTAGIVCTEGYPTIAKTRIVAQQQQVVRLDHEVISPATDREVATVMSYAKSVFGEVDALIIEDYGKGLVTQKLVDEMVPAALAAGLIVTVDPNPGNPLAWRGVTAVKPNRREAFLEAGFPLESAADSRNPLGDQLLAEVGERLLERWDCEMIPITLGEWGMMLFQRNGAPHHVPTRARDVFDVSGAGDTAIALFTAALAAGASPVEATEIANYASGVVVGKLGTATLTPGELREAVRSDEGAEDN